MLTTVYNIISLVDGVFEGAERVDIHEHRWAPRGPKDLPAAVWQKENIMMSYVVLMTWVVNVGDRKPDTGLIPGVHW